MSYSVGRVAAIAGVSVRTLHHYDAVGLLRPVTRSPGGYRLYKATDLERLQQMRTAVEHEMEARQVGISMTPEERFEVFGDFRGEDHEDEAKKRWGDTDAYKESQRRVASYTKEDWARLKAEGEAIDNRLASVMNSGAPADSEQAMDAAEQHRQHITRWFYDCSSEIHVGLAEMYVSDPRFKARYDEIASGLAQFVHDAVNANATR